MKIKTSNNQQFRRACSALVRVWRAQASLHSKHIDMEDDTVSMQGLKGLATGLRTCADQLEEIVEAFK